MVSMVLGISIEVWALGISIIALTASLIKDFISPSIFKPNINIEGKNDEECVDDAIKKITHEDPIGMFNLPVVGVSISDKKQITPIKEIRSRERWLRLRIKNKGGFLSRTAKNCYVKLIEIRNSDNQCIRPFNTFPLMWVSYAESKSNLAKGESHLLNLALEIEGNRVLYPATWKSFGLPTSLLERKEEKLGPGIYTFKVGVYGDNFKPITKSFKISMSSKFGELKFAD